MFYQVLLTVLGLCIAFEIKCPEPAQWSLRARLHCPNPSLYYCLLSIDGNTRINLENCSYVDLEAPGRRIVIRFNIDSLPCSDDKFQPIKYWTNVSSDCLFLTSKCTEEGQVLYSVDRYHEYDITCRCDHTRGYDFVTRPKNQCFCIPSQEDCSCYKKTCSTVNSDYKCIEETQKSVVELCSVPNITSDGISKVVLTLLPKINQTDQGNTGNSAKTPTVVAVLLVTIIFICSCVVYLRCRKEYFVKALDPKICIEGEDCILECQVLYNSMEASWFKGDTAIKPQKDKYEVNHNGKEHILNILNLNLEDTGEYKIRIKHCISRAQLTVQEYFTQNSDTTVECLEGENVEITYDVIFDDVPAEWKKDDAIVNNSSKYEIKAMGKSHTLSVIQVELQDAGNYSVNVDGRVRSAYLQVREYFKQNSDTTVECLEGENVELTYDVIFDDVPAEWKKDDAIVNNSSKYKIKAMGKSHTLSVIQVELQDAGNYSVNVDGRVRSAYLQVREIPAAIKQLSEDDKDLYLHIVKSGTETRYYIRIVIIGENGVGKTCLLRRLLGEPIEGVKSTDGVEIVHTCKIRLSDGLWINEKVTDERKAVLTRIRRAVNNKILGDAHLQDALNSQSAKPLIMQDAHLQNNLFIESSKPKKSENARLQETINSKSDEPKAAEQSMQKIVEPEFKEDSEFLRPESNDEEKEFDAPIALDNEANTPDTFNQSTNLQRHHFKNAVDELSKLENDIEKYDVPKEVLVDCGFWDFAGQREYYPTHPIFLNPNALHLLVADVTKDIKEINTEKGYNSIGEYIDFWFDSIHSCGAVEKTMDTPGDYPNPPVIVVCTGIDKCKNEIEDRKDKFRKHFLSIIEQEAKYKHLRQICYVSNTEPADADFEVLRQSIFGFGKKMKMFGEKLPLRWIRLEHALHTLCDAGVNILSLHDINELSSIYSVEGEKEIQLFLNYQHNVGGIIYFKSLKEHIILNQKWLADAFRCLVSINVDSEIKITPEWRKLETTGQLDDALIEKLFKKEPRLEFSKHKDHILKVMELFGIIVKRTNFQDDRKPIYYMPCMISEQTSVFEVKTVFEVDKCTMCTPWLCIEFDFMPLDFFNHILCYYISRYALCSELSTKRVAIYHGMGIFYLDKNKASNFILCFSKNTIAIQLWQWGEIEHKDYESIREELESVILGVKNKNEPRSVSYIVKIKCSDGDIHERKGRYSYKELIELELSNKKYFCEEHKKNHSIEDIFQTWFKDYYEMSKDFVFWNNKLLFAAKVGNNNSIKLCLANGANANFEDPSGVTPLHWSAENAHTASVVLLIEYGSNINSKDITGQIPLHKAAVRGHTDTVAMLLRHGSSINSKDGMGRTPYDLAGNKVIRKLLKAAQDNIIEDLLKELNELGR